MLNPTSWQEVMIERARCEGYLQGCAGVRQHSPGWHDATQRLAALNVVKRCEGCEGTGKGEHLSGNDEYACENAVCSDCGGTGIEANKC